MESIVQLRQMMAEQKFFEVQKLVEVQLALHEKTLRHELLLILFDSLLAQQKALPASLILELAELELGLNHFDTVSGLLEKFSLEEERKYYSKISELKIYSADKRGLIDELYSLIGKFLIHQYENQIPYIPEYVTRIQNKYFTGHFGLKLQMLGIALVRSDLKLAEAITMELILSCVEKSSPKGVNEKLDSIAQVLKSGADKAQLEIYQNLCLLASQASITKADYKKIVEMILYFENFKFQVIVLDLLHNLNLLEEAQQYVQTIKSNEDYDYVYLDKYYTHLKKYFFFKEKSKTTERPVPEAPDLSLETDYISEVVGPLLESEISEEELKLFRLLKFQEYSVDQLCDLAVGMLQSEFPRVGLEASNRALFQSSNNVEFLKAAYLKLTCLLQLKDYRAALDVCLQGLNKANSKDDILSFMYGQAEIYIRLNEMRQAKKILSKILTIDNQYRLAKERLDKLNEI